MDELRYAPYAGPMSGCVPLLRRSCRHLASMIVNAGSAFTPRRSLGLLIVLGLLTVLWLVVPLITHTNNSRNGGRDDDGPCTSKPPTGFPSFQVGCPPPFRQPKSPFPQDTRSGEINPFEPARTTIRVLGALDRVRIDRPQD